LEEDVFFTVVSPDLIDHCWPGASEMLEKAVNHSGGRYELSDLKFQLDNNSQNLWILYRGSDEMIMAMTTMFVHYPKKKFLNVTFCGSGNKEMAAVKYKDIFVPKINEWASLHDCHGVEVVGRKGWAKILESYGYKTTYYTLEVEV
tara:strand:- start:30068 stop:30505 length:438 start_codon:yes stop_codon:yes gene_type:complete